MTIAACYLSHEGVVFGADSTTTMYVQGRGPNPIGCEHHFDFAQKIFEIGKGGTLAIAWWGLGSLGNLSYRTLIAQFSDSLTQSPAVNMEEITKRWSDLFWSHYKAAWSPYIDRVQVLNDIQNRTDDESGELAHLSHKLSDGFCLGGYCLPDRNPSAFEMFYSPEQETAPPMQPIPLGSWRLWGCYNLLERLLFGMETGIISDILNSGQWNGSKDDLMALLQPYILAQPVDLPIREAIDWIHASIYSTIKAMKFSQMAPVCGGPIEIAVITTDRPFRWVIHKDLDAAVAHDGFVND